MKYRHGSITWDDLVAFFKTYPWRMPDLPDSGDYLGWGELPDTFQEGARSRVPTSTSCPPTTSARP
jgi:hypothetical protein